MFEIHNSNFHNLKEPSNLGFHKFEISYIKLIHFIFIQTFDLD